MNEFELWTIVGDHQRNLAGPPILFLFANLILWHFIHHYWSTRTAFDIQEVP